MLRFSPDGRRFYDLRSSCVNAWEPNCLTSSLENEGKTSDTEGKSRLSTAASQMPPDIITYFPLTALAVAPGGAFYCAGFQDGGVMMYGIGDNQGTQIMQFYSFLDISHLRWSSDGRYLAAADLVGDIAVLESKSEKHGTGKPRGMSKMPSPQITLGDRVIVDMVLNPDG